MKDSAGTVLGADCWTRCPARENAIESIFLTNAPNCSIYETRTLQYATEALSSCGGLRIYGICGKLRWNFSINTTRKPNMPPSIHKATLKRFTGHASLLLICCAVAALLIWALGSPVEAERIAGASASALSTPVLMDGVAGRPHGAVVAPSSPSDQASVPQGPFWGAWLLGLGAAILIGADTLGSGRSAGANKP